MRKKMNKKLLDLEVKRLTKSMLKGSCCGGYGYWMRFYLWLCERYWGYGESPSCTSCPSGEKENTGCSGTYYK